MTPAEQRQPRESLRAAFGWNLIGTATYAASQWAMLAVLARLGEPAVAEARLGVFVYGMAVAAPLVLLLSMQTRSVLAADHRERYPFAAYLWQRVLAMALMVVVGIAWAALAGVDGAVVVALIVLARGVEGVSELAHGLLQRERRMWTVGVSQVLRGICGVLALALGTYCTGDLVVGSLALVLAWAGIGIAWDWPQCRRALIASAGRAPPTRASQTSVSPTGGPDSSGQGPAESSTHQVRAPRETVDPPTAETSHGTGPLRAQLWTLSQETAALGVVSGVVALTTNLPRYMIESFSGTRELGVFAALAYVMVALAMVTQSLSAAALPRLGEAWQRGDLASVRTLTVRAVVVVSVPSGLAILPCWLAGDWIMALLYRPEFAAYGHLLWWFCLLAWLSSIAGVLRSTMTACGELRVQLPLSVVTAALTAVGTYVLVTQDPLWSGVVGLLAGRLFQVVSHSYVVYRVLRRSPSPSAS